MNFYDFKKLEKCYVCGNIDKNMDKFINLLTSNLSKYEKVEHPKELERQERLRNRQNERPQMGMGLRRRNMEDELRASFKKISKGKYDSGYNDSVIIVSGNCGIGSKSMNYYNEVFEKLNKVLCENNCFLLFVRGNNDDPSIFNECKIDMSNVKTIPDYSVITLKPFNCLCIGGSVSLDKEWKLSQQEQFGKKLFWENEQPFFDEKALDEILSKYQIGCVITSTSPSFAFPGTNAFNKSKWIATDSKMKSAFSSERKILDKIYDKFMDTDVKPYVWIYGRFKQHNHTKVNDIVFDSLGAFQFEDVRNLITSYFSIDLSKKLGGNVFTFDTFIADDENHPSMGYAIHMDDEDVEGEVGEEDAFEEEGTNELDEILMQDSARTVEPQELPQMGAATAATYNPHVFTQEDIDRITRQLQSDTTNVTVTTMQEQERARGVFEPYYYNVEWRPNTLGEITHNGR